MKRKVMVSGGIMKVGGYLLAIGMLVALTAGPAAAWKITFENRSGGPAFCRVWGEHLFWHQVDCEVGVINKDIKDCVMPGGICPTKVECKTVPCNFGACTTGDSSINFNGPQCWDHSYKISNVNGKQHLGN
jgi:hypothetical protein